MTDRWRGITVVALVAAIPAIATAGPFDGIWTDVPGRCEAMYENRVRVLGDELRMWEETCYLTRPRAAAGPMGAVFYDAHCLGFAEEWNETIFLAPVGDNRIAMASSPTGQFTEGAGILYRCE